MIVADLRGEFEIGAQERGPQLGNEFLVGIACVAPALAVEIALQPLPSVSAACRRGRPSGSSRPPSRGARRNSPSRPAPVAGRLGQPVTIPGARKELSEALIYTGYFRLPD